jgi:hypothetical protein
MTEERGNDSLAPVYRRVLASVGRNGIERRIGRARQFADRERASVADAYHGPVVARYFFNIFDGNAEPRERVKEFYRKPSV